MIGARSAASEERWLASTEEDADAARHEAGATGRVNAVPRPTMVSVVSGAASPRRWWAWATETGSGTGPQRKAYEEIIDDEEAYWTSLSRLHNVGILLVYLLTGFVPSFVSTPLSVYLVREIDAHPVVQNQISICVSIPWAFKLLFGFVSDACPLLGLRRKPYMYLGTLLSSAAYAWLGSLGQPSAPALGLGLCLATVGMVMADTMGDAMVVSRSRTEPEESHGHLQGSLYLYRFGGAVAGAVAGAALYNRKDWGFGLTFAQVMYAAGALPLACLLPFLPMLKEMPPPTRARARSRSRGRSRSFGQGPGPSGADVIAVAAPEDVTLGGPPEAGAGRGEEEEEEPPEFLPVSAQCAQIWRVIQLPIVYGPMAFVYVYNVMQIPNVAWTSFLQLNLGFTPYLLGALSFASRVMTFLGILLYKTYFLRSSWPLVYVWTTLLTATFSLLQLLLIFQINIRMGIPNWLFALGDDTLAAFVVGIQFLPLCVQYLKLCPGGSEGATYAMLTTFGNVALIAGNSVGTLFGKIWDVSNAALSRNDLSGLWKLTLLTSCLSPLPLALLPLLPSDAAQQKAMRDGSRASPLAGIVFLATLALSLGWIIGQAVWVLLQDEPG